jgi:hypothetical protein
LEAKIRVVGGICIAVGVLGALTAIVFLDYTSGGAEILGSWFPPGFLNGLMLLVLALTIPYIVAGIGLTRLKPWARPTAMIVFTCGLVSFPFGTALGIYGLSLLSSEEADEVFSPRFPR